MTKFFKPMQYFFGIGLPQLSSTRARPCASMQHAKDGWMRTDNKLGFLAKQ